MMKEDCREEDLDSQKLCKEETMLQPDDGAHDLIGNWLLTNFP